APAGMVLPNSKDGPSRRSNNLDRPNRIPRTEPSRTLSNKAPAKLVNVATMAGHNLPVAHNCPMAGSHSDGTGKYGEAGEPKSCQRASPRANGSRPRTGAAPLVR